MIKILNRCCAFSLAIALFITTHVTAETAPPFSLVVPAGQGAQEGNAVAVDAIGISGDFGSTTLTGLGSQDGFITKHNAVGQLAWVKQAGSDSGDILRNITLDDSGKVYVSGEGDASAFDLEPFTLVGRVAVARLDTSSVPPGPVLSLTRSGNELILSWPASETGYELKTTSDLTQPFGNAQVTLTPVPNQINVFTMPLPEGNLFYRLQKP